MSKLKAFSIKNNYMNIQKISKNKGFTLIEILVVIAIIAILAAIVIVAINPAKRFQDSRQAQRQSNVAAILNAIQQNMVDNKGITTCTIPTGTAGVIKSSPSGSDTDLTTCLAPYLAVLPIDPSAGTGSAIVGGTYNSRYTVKMDNTTKQVTVAAPDTETTTGVACTTTTTPPCITLTR